MTLFIKIISRSIITYLVLYSQISFSVNFTYNTLGDSLFSISEIPYRDHLYTATFQNDTFFNNYQLLKEEKISPHQGEKLLELLMADIPTQPDIFNGDVVPLGCNKFYNCFMNAIYESEFHYLHYIYGDSIELVIGKNQSLVNSGIETFTWFNNTTVIFSRIPTPSVFLFLSFGFVVFLLKTKFIKV